MSLIINHPILCFFALVSMYVFFRLFVLGRIKMYWASYQIRRAAKRHRDNPELQKQLTDIADGIDELTRDGEFDEL